MVWNFGYTECMDEYHMAKRVLVVEISGGWVWSRLVWLDEWSEVGLLYQRDNSGGQNGIDGGKWRAGVGYTVVRLDGWMDGVKVALFTQGMTAGELDNA